MDALSFCRKLRMWFRTVCRLMRKSAAIRGVSRPKATSRNTCASRRLKANGGAWLPAAAGWSAARPASPLIHCFVTVFSGRGSGTAIRVIEEVKEEGPVIVGACCNHWCNVDPLPLT